MFSAGVTQLVECQPSKLGVASSNLVSRSTLCLRLGHTMVFAYIAQSVEHFLGKEEVTGSSPVVGLSSLSTFFLGTMCSKG